MKIVGGVHSYSSRVIYECEFFTISKLYGNPHLFAIKLKCNLEDERFPNNTIIVDIGNEKLNDNWIDYSIVSDVFEMLAKNNYLIPFINAMAKTNYKKGFQDGKDEIRNGLKNLLEI